MEKFNGLGKVLSRDAQKMIYGQSGTGKKTCNCYTTDPAKGTDVTCGCNDGIGTCCGDGYTHMNCGSCS